MLTVYELVMIDKEASCGEHADEFNIGFFSDRAVAEKTAERYLSEVKGFKDHPVEYKIAEKRIIGVSDSLMQDDLYIVYGWNENDELDEVDVIESDCFLDIGDAEKQLDLLRAEFDRKEWCIDKYRIDECSWQDGFERV